jgi:hypothetical protein
MTNYFSKILVLQILFLSLLILKGCCTISSEVKHSKVKIHLESKEQIKQLALDGLILDHTYYERKSSGFSLTVVLNDKEMKILSKSKLQYDILIDNLIDDYNSRINNE